MSLSAFVAFMQIDSLLLGKVYSACEHLIVCFKLQDDWKSEEKSILEKRLKVFGNVRNYMMLAAHALRSKDCRQVHTVKPSCSGTSVVLVPSAQKTLWFASQRHEAVVILCGFFRQ